VAPDLYVLDHAGPGPLVVLVHGTLDRSTSFSKARALLGDLHVVAYDRRGYGRSMHLPPPASVAGHAEDLVAVLDGRPATLVGHSLGADVCMAVAVERPELVRSLGLWEPPMPWLDWWVAGMDRPSAGASTIQDAAEAAPEMAAEIFFRRMVGDEVWERLPQATKDKRRAEGPAVMSDLLGIRMAPPFDLADVRAPAVAGHGTASAPHQIRGVPQLVRELPDAELFVIEGAGHGAHASHPAEFAAFVRAAVARAAA
jgi:pimeloyl-ACP methyl ester carboxylesterase